MNDRRCSLLFRRDELRSFNVKINVSFLTFNASPSCAEYSGIQFEGYVLDTGNSSSPQEVLEVCAQD
jgi:hypothetical protein